MRMNLNTPLPLNVQELRQKLGPKTSAPQGQDLARIRQVAQEFESLLMERMVREMRTSLPKNPLFGESQGEDMFREMLDGEYSRLMEQRGGMGLTSFLTHKLSGQISHK